MSQVLRYSVIRYFPWSERDEFVNVGVVLESTHGTVYRLLDPKKYYLRTDLQREEIEELWESLEFSFFRTTDVVPGRLQRDSRTPRVLPLPLEHCIRELTGHVQCGDIRTIVTAREDPHLIVEHLSSVFAREVARHLKRPRKRAAGQQRYLKPRLRMDLSNWDVLDKLQQGQDLIVRAPWPMDYVYAAGGTENGIRVLDCAAKAMSEAIRVVYGAIRDIEESGRAPVTVIAVVGNRKGNERPFALANQLLLTDRRQPLRFVDYDTPRGRETLREILQQDQPPTPALRTH